MNTFNWSEVLVFIAGVVFFPGLAFVAVLRQRRIKAQWSARATEDDRGNGIEDAAALAAAEREMTNTNLAEANEAFARDFVEIQKYSSLNGVSENYAEDVFRFLQKRGIHSEWRQFTGLPAGVASATPLNLWKLYVEREKESEARAALADFKREH